MRLVYDERELSGQAVTLVYLACTVAGYLVGLWLYREKPAYEVAQLSDMLEWYQGRDYHSPMESSQDTSPYDNMMVRPEDALGVSFGFSHDPPNDMRNMTPEERHALDVIKGVWRKP